MQRKWEYLYYARWNLIQVSTFQTTNLTKRSSEYEKYQLYEPFRLYSFFFEMAVVTQFEVDSIFLSLSTRNDLNFTYV